DKGDPNALFLLEGMMEVIGEDVDAGKINIVGEAFTDGCIGDWAADAQAVITAVTDGSVVLVGSSMGGWISCLLSQRLPRVAGFVGIAAAPDFTEDGMWASFDDAQRKTLWDEGVLMLPSDYDAPYAVTRKIIEDGRNHLVLRAPLPMNFPVRLLQGSDDVDVLPQVAVALLNHIEGGDVRMVLVKGADHRFSSPDCLALLERTVAEVAPIK
ncbi:MAG: alpha/beta fold hydrolase, partial [Paracoccaceae bacterium]